MDCQWRQGSVDAAGNSLVQFVIGRSISLGRDISGGRQRNLRLCRLGLLATLLRRLFFLQLLVRKRGQRTRDLLDLVARQLLGDLLDEILQEDGILRFLRVLRYQRDQRLAERRELVFCVRVEDLEGGEVNGGTWIAGVGEGDLL